MSYSDEWLKHVHAIRQYSKPAEPAVTHRRLGDLPPCERHTTWKPWAEMTAEERRKALEQRDRTK